MDPSKDAVVLGRRIKQHMIIPVTLLSLQNYLIIEYLNKIIHSCKTTTEPTLLKIQYVRKKSEDELA
jgi:hypothetical protein